MIIRAIIKVQLFSSKDGGTFLDARQDSHGVARGEVQFWAVESSNWVGVQNIVRHQFAGHSNINAKTVVAWFKDIGTPRRRLWRLPESTLELLVGLDRWMDTVGVRLDKWIFD